jgi:hypothetical protein
MFILSTNKTRVGKISQILNIHIFSDTLYPVLRIHKENLRSWYSFTADANLIIQEENIFPINIIKYCTALAVLVRIYRLIHSIFHTSFIPLLHRRYYTLVELSNSRTVELSNSRTDRLSSYSSTDSLNWRTDWLTLWLTHSWCRGPA